MAPNEISLKTQALARQLARLVSNLSTQDRTKTKPSKVKANVTPKQKPVKKLRASSAKFGAVPTNTLRCSAIRALNLKLKTHPIRGVCFVARCAKRTAKPRARWCRHHKQLIRTEQLKLNNEAWRKRAAKGRAGHHLTYRDRPTKWAATNKTKAIQWARKGHGVTPIPKLQKILRGVSVAA